MSRIGRAPVAVPAGVKIEIGGNNVVTVSGKNGTLTRKFAPCITLNYDEGAKEIKLERPLEEDGKETEDPEAKRLHGLSRALLHNMVVGVSEGFQKTLIIKGVGYKAVLAGNKLTLSLGYSHDIVYPVPEGIKIQITDGTKLQITGIDKQLVGEVAASIRKFKKPEPYKGKGVRYSDEHVVIKPGKTNQ